MLNFRQRIGEHRARGQSARHHAERCIHHAARLNEALLPPVTSAWQIKSSSKVSSRYQEKERGRQSPQPLTEDLKRLPAEYRPAPNRVCSRLLTVGVSRKLAAVVLVKGFLNCAGGFPGIFGAGLGMIQAHALHPHGEVEIFKPGQFSRHHFCGEPNCATPSPSLRSARCAILSRLGWEWGIAS
jgi:hypothetical protein